VKVNEPTCSNGHLVEQSATFCGQCGVRFAPVPPTPRVATSAPSGPPAKARPATATHKHAPQRKGVALWQWITLGFIGFAFVGFLAFSALNGDGSDTFEAVMPTAEEFSPEEASAVACYEEIAPLVDLLIDNDGSDAALNEVALRIGSSDPRFMFVLETHRAWNSEALRNGRDSANDVAGEMITNWCLDNPDY